MYRRLFWIVVSKYRSHCIRGYGNIIEFFYVYKAICFRVLSTSLVFYSCDTVNFLKGRIKKSKMKRERKTPKKCFNGKL